MEMRSVARRRPDSACFEQTLLSSGVHYIGRLSGAALPNTALTRRICRVVPRSGTAGPTSCEGPSQSRRAPCPAPADARRTDMGARTSEPPAHALQHYCHDSDPSGMMWTPPAPAASLPRVVHPPPPMKDRAFHETPASLPVIARFHSRRSCRTGPRHHVRPGRFGRRYPAWRCPPHRWRHEHGLCGDDAP